MSAVDSNGLKLASYVYGLSLYLLSGIVASNLRDPRSQVIVLLYGITGAALTIPFLARGVSFLVRVGRTTGIIAGLVALASYSYPLLYVALADPSLTDPVAVLSARFLPLGAVPGLMMVYRGNRDKAVVTLGFLLSVLDVIVSLAFESTFGVSIATLLLLDSQFLTVGLSMMGPNTTAALPQISSRPVPRQVQGSARATVIVTGLPPNCPAPLYVNGRRLSPTSVQSGTEYFEVPPNSVVTVKRAVCQGVTYVPDRTHDIATVYQPLVVNYSPSSVPVPTPSVALMKRSLGNWDPQVWVNRSISVYRIEKVIGEGGNGYVLKGKVEGKEVAIKVLKLLGGKPEDYFAELTSEASNLVSLSRHDNIVKIYAVNVDSFVIGEILNGNTKLYLTNPPMIVMELMEGGTLKDLLGDDKFFYSAYWRRAVMRAFCEVAKALEYVHSNGFVHMDVKPQNIFLDKRPADPYSLELVHYKLGDLGSAVRVNGRVKQLTPEYAPPDALLGVAKPALDVFALGMTAYVLLGRKLDRPDMNEMNDAVDCYINNDMACVRDRVEKAKAELAAWNFSVDPQLDSLIKSMLSPDPATRPTAREVVDAIRAIDPTVC